MPDRRDGRRPDIGEIAALIDRQARLGAIEIKGGWSKGEAVIGHRLAVAMSRCFVHAMNWLGAEFAIAAVSDRLLPVGEITGAQVVGTHAVPFPDERYRTVAVCIYRRRPTSSARPRISRLCGSRESSFPRAPIKRSRGHRRCLGERALTTSAGA